VLRLERRRRTRVGLVLLALSLVMLVSAPPGGAVPPVITPVFTGTTGQNGWWVSNVTVQFQITGDVTSSSGCDVRTLTTDGTHTELVCTATGPDGTAQSNPAVRIDKTAPTVTSGLDRPANGNGWHNQPVKFTVSGVSDATSGLGPCTSPPTYSGPDNASVPLSGDCRDNAGNISARSVTVKYDATSPTVNAGLARSADANGWYNHSVALVLTRSDGTSGIDSCVEPTYSGPDTANASITGSCTDKAGNSTSRSVPLKYDATAAAVSATLSRLPDSSGWYNSAVELAFSGADATSGIASCTQATYQGPDTGGTSLGGNCTDKAGNVGGASSVAFRYDATPPTISASLDRGPDSGGWFNHSVKLTASGEDGLSGLASCSSPSYSGPDGAGASLTATCSDAAGNTAASTADFRYDATAPSVNAALAREPDANGWYNHAVQLTTSGSDGASGLASCSSPSYGGPDTRGTALTGTCTDVAGNGASRAVTLRYDSTPPTVTAGLARAPDANGWFNGPVKLTTTGADATSGVDACTSPTYGGPDDATASLTGSCRDAAGNAASQTAGLRYDSTPPRLTGVTVASRSGAVIVSWSASADTASVTVKRSRDRKGASQTNVYKGTGRSITDRGLKNGVRYRYAVAAVDVAGNVKSLVAEGEPRALRTPAEGARVKRAPTLSWWGVSKADYYNVQIYYGRLKVLSLWPVLEKLVLKRTWRYEGKSFELVPGRYRWYVWPGLGARKLNRYGPLLGSGSFVVAK
jgi:hypothetical protein